MIVDRFRSKQTSATGFRESRNSMVKAILMNANLRSTLYGPGRRWPEVESA